MTVETKKIGTVSINGQEKELRSGMQGDRYFQEVDGIEFSGHRVLWSFSYEPKTYLKESELSGDEWRKGGSAKIFRNGVCVYNEFCREPERAFRILSYNLPKLQEFDFDGLKVGRKIYNHDIPAVITEVLADGEIMVQSENGEIFPWAFKQEEKKENPEGYEDEWKDKDRVHILSEHIYWYRK